MIYPALWSPEVETRIRTEARNLDPQTTPSDVRMCVKCCMTNQRPRITFDAEGVCSACRFTEYKDQIDWHGREWQLENLLVKHRRNTGYDVIVPASGGKDSSYVADQLKRVYGMRPLLVKFAPFMYADIGLQNWRAVNAAGFDCIEFAPAQPIHRKLARLALEYLGDPFDPFVYGQLGLPMRLAKQLGISLVFYGENGEAEYGGDMKAANKPCWARDDWERVYNKGLGFNQLLGRGEQLGAFSGREVLMATEYYELPKAEDGVEFHWFGYYKRWHPMQNFYEASERCGFTPNPERSEGTYTKMASLDDKLDGLHYFMAYVKFGIGRCTSDAAQQVRNGDIDRDEALALVAKYDGEMPTKYLDECLDYLGMDRAHLDTIIERFRGAQVPIDKSLGRAWTAFDQNRAA